MTLSIYNVSKEKIKKDSRELNYLDYLTVVIGPKATYEISSKLSLLGAREIKDLSFKELNEDFGLGEVAALRVRAAIEMAGSILLNSAEKQNPVKSPRDTYEIFRYLELNSQEVFSIALLNTKNEVIKVHDVFKGSINSSIVHPREIFREAIKERSSSMVVAHNHPSGDPRPSQEDLNVTDRL